MYSLSTKLKTKYHELNLAQNVLVIFDAKLCMSRRKLAEKYKISKGKSSDDEEKEILRPKISRAELTVFLDEMKRFATLYHQSFLQNLRNTEESFYDTLFES